jgi:hypothetical protein
MLTGILAASASGGITAITVTPELGLVVGIVAAAVSAVSPLRWLLSLGALGAASAAGVYTTAMQYIHHYPPGAFWPGHFETASQLAWVGIALLAADALVEMARWGRASAYGFTRDAADTSSGGNDSGGGA